MRKKSERQKQFKKSLCMIALITSCLFVFAGCKKSSDNENNTEDGAGTITTAPELTGTAGNENGDEVTEEPADEATPTGTVNAGDEAQEETKPSDEEQSEAAFYGNWVISQVLAYGRVGTYSKEDAEALIGNTLIFSPEQATCFGDQASYLEQVAANPVYTQTELSATEFMTNFQNTFENLGITADTIKQVSVADSAGNGCIFFVVDENTLIIYGGGTFFQLERVNED
jgi:hypothetical protein